MDWLFKYPEKCYCLKGWAWKPRINTDSVSFIFFEHTHMYSTSLSMIHYTHTHTHLHILPLQTPLPSVMMNYTLCLPLLDWNLLTAQDRSVSFMHAHTHTPSPRHSTAHNHTNTTKHWRLHPDTQRPHIFLCSLSLSSCPFWQSACPFQPLWRRNHRVVTITSESYCKRLEVISTTLYLPHHFSLCTYSSSSHFALAEPLNYTVLWPTASFSLLYVQTNKLVYIKLYLCGCEGF